MRLSLFAFVLVSAVLVESLPQWPYRDGMESYYGYQDNKNYYRAGSVEDDEGDSERQDLKVGAQGGGQSPGASVSPSQVQVLETGSPKPVSSITSASVPTDSKVNNKQATQPFVSQPNNQATPQKTPAFPPAQPSPPSTPTDEDSEEDSDEEEEAGDDEGDQDDDNEDEENDDEDEDRRRQEPIETKKNDINKKTIQKVNQKVKSNSTTVLPVVDSDESVEKVNKTVLRKHGSETIEALVPGYITDQGEVLVPFDTVVNRDRPISIIPDPSYSGGKEQVDSPPVIVGKPSPPTTRQVPQFFRKTSGQKYYSAVPPPGSIFTFDDDEEVNTDSRLRQEDLSSEEDDIQNDEEDQSEESENDDEDQSEEEDVAPPRPPLAVVKATAPSGEDDEAESLGLRPGSLGRSGFVSEEYVDYPNVRGPNYQGPYPGGKINPYAAIAFGYPGGFNNYDRDNYYPNEYYQRPNYGQRPYRPNYGPNNYQRPHYRPESHYRPEYRPQYNRPQNRPQYINRPNYNRPHYTGFYSSSPFTRERPETNTIYYYRPETQKVTKVIPVANFEISIEHDQQSGEFKPIISPFYYNGKKQAQKTETPIRRPVSRPQIRPHLTRRPPQTQNPQYSQNQQHFVAVFGRPTPVTRQRSNLKQKNISRVRGERQLKNPKNKEKKSSDPLGLLKNLHNNKKNKQSKH